ncbi:MAG: hypothetical protein ABIP75_18830, partial [Pyrinomonadaceae bacterium]
MNQTRWLLCLSVALLMQINTGAQGPAGIISRESDERAISAGDRQSALTALLNEADRLRAAQQPSAAARLLTRAGYLQLKLAQPAEALRTFNDALRLVTDTADIINQTDTLNGIGAVYTSKTKCPEAKTALTRALSLSDQDHYLKGRAQALLTLSECQDYDNHTVALATANESLAIWTQINHQWGIAKTNAAIGIYLFSLNQLTEATVHFETALHIWRALALTDEQADLLISLSFIEYRKGAWQNNISDLTEARTLIDEQSEPYKLGQINANLGETYIASGLPEAALPSLDLGLQYFERAQNPRAVSAVIWVKGKALLLLNDLPHALEQFNAALAGFAARKEGIGMAICH